MPPFIKCECRETFERRRVRSERREDSEKVAGRVLTADVDLDRRSSLRSRDVSSIVQPGHLRQGKA